MCAIVVEVEERKAAKLAGETDRRDVVGEDLKLGICVCRDVSIDE